MISRVAIALLVLTQALAAQNPSGPPRQAAERAPDSAGRARLAGDIRRGFARAVRQRVGLSDTQMRQLGPLSQRHEQQRRRLQLEERNTRTSLRVAVRDYQPADSAKVGQLLQNLIDIQRRRVQLLESEQRDLSAIMTPVQRARYLALQEQVRRRLEQMRQRR
jgi:periplasmic protein CpxP/Spy